MLPAHLAENIRKQVLFYLQSTFDFREKSVEKAFERFLTDPDTGLFKGPWVQLRRPYRPADANERVPFDFPVEFHPFKHQNRSWRRLTSTSQQHKPTIVKTGTGSGKTECFLFPILDHCLRARKEGQKGMEHYDSLSGDRSDERNREYYQTIRSFDLTQDTPAGAVGDEGLPFGIEYHASVIMREVNVGYQGEQGMVPFGVDQEAPEDGFRVCRDCGIVVTPGTSLDDIRHRRSCSRRRANDKRRQEGRYF